MASVGENILAERKRLGWTQEELATKMGYKSKSAINKIELGINDVSQSKIVKFAKVFGTTPGHLMGWDADSSETNLSEGEKLLIDLFRKVPEDQQDLVISMIQAALGSI